MKRITPFIEKLYPEEIFVFGSNLDGHHSGGAARMAYDIFGAEWGVGVGFTGNCYAIPTMFFDPSEIKPYIDTFLKEASELKEITFYVTEIGCGIAGFKPEQIAPFFKEALDMRNVWLPQRFVDILFKDFDAISDSFEVLSKIGTNLQDVNTIKKSRCCGRCDGVNDICVSDMICEEHKKMGCETCYEKR